MERTMHRNSYARTLQHIASHAGVTLLAVGIAFSLPVLAKFILFTWWPMVAGDSQLLMINELIFAAMLVLLFNMSLKAWEAQISHRLNSWPRWCMCVRKAAPSPADSTASFTGASVVHVMCRSCPLPVSIPSYPRCAVFARAPDPGVNQPGGYQPTQNYPAGAN